MLELADVAGGSGNNLTLWWKARSQPESVIGGYAGHWKGGLRSVSPRAIILRLIQMSNTALHGRKVLL